MLSMLLAVAAAQVASPAVPADIAEPNPKTMKAAEIAAFNAKLSRSHPYYIRCVRSVETGSLVKRTFSCRTNAQWQSADTRGNDNARETYEHMQSKAGNSSN